MKQIQFFFGSIVFCAMVSLLATSCNTTKKGQMTENNLTVTLKNGLTGKYFAKSYAQYDPAKISISNRTLNQYRVSFTCTAKSFKALWKALTEDANVKEALIAGAGDEKIQSSTNEGHGKVKPIKSNN